MSVDRNDKVFANSSMDESKVDFSINNVPKELNQSIKISLNTYRQHEKQINESIVNCIDELKDDSLHRHLSDARLRRRQRRRMSEVDGKFIEQVFYLSNIFKSVLNRFFNITINFHSIYALNNRMELFE